MDANKKEFNMKGNTEQATFFKGCSVTREPLSDIKRFEQLCSSQQRSLDVAARPNTLMSNPSQKTDGTSLFVRGVSTESYEKFNGYTKRPQIPEFKPPESLEVTSLLEALRSEPKVTNPDFVYSEALKMLNTIKESGTLDRYILSDEEAATLCAAPLLMKAGLDFSEAADLCKEKPPTMLSVLLLKSLRKLPQTRAVFYFGEANNRLPQRTKGNYLQRSYVVASRSMQAVKDSLEKEEGRLCKEIFRVEGGWGYDIGDFVQAGSEDLIIFEPWRVFSVADSGVKDEKSGVSVVLLNFVEEKLLYEKEIKPGMLRHIIPILEENPKYLRVLSEMTFDKRNCKRNNT